MIPNEVEGSKLKALPESRLNAPLLAAGMKGDNINEAYSAGKMPRSLLWGTSRFML